MLGRGEEGRKRGRKEIFLCKSDERVWEEMHACWLNGTVESRRRVLVGANIRGIKK